MDEVLQEETRRLTRAWAHYDATMLRDYLVADVEDPRINVQSILTRHFLIGAVFGDRFDQVIGEELRFAVAVNWLRSLASQPISPREWHAVKRALEQSADDAEGIEVPLWMGRSYAMVSAPAGSAEKANYLAGALDQLCGGATAKAVLEDAAASFVQRWRDLLDREPDPATRLTVLEPACGSANDYRFIAACGLARFLDYTGFDLCETNVANARQLFPAVRWTVGNVFEIGAADGAYDCCIVHDLLEHLSPAGLDAAIRELCRVTRRGLAIGCFNLHEEPEDWVRPVDDYHCSRLSVDRLRERFAAAGFSARVIHVGTCLRMLFGCDRTHNPNAYTFVLTAGG